MRVWAGTVHDSSRPPYLETVANGPAPAASGLGTPDRAGWAQLRYRVAYVYSVSQASPCLNVVSGASASGVQRVLERVQLAAHHQTLRPCYPYIGYILVHNGWA